MNNPRYSVQLIGTANGSNCSFTFPSSPVHGTEAIYVDGKRLYPGTDYQQTALSVTFVVAPPSNRPPLADYDEGSWTSTQPSTDTVTATGYAGGSGDVVGPASSTDNAIARFDGATGKLIQGSVVIVTDLGAFTGVTALTTDEIKVAAAGGLKALSSGAAQYLAISPTSALTATRTLSIATGDADRTLTFTADASIGGTNTGDQTNALLDGVNHTDTLAGSVARGDLIIGNSTPKWSRLAKGSANTFLKSDGTDLSWATPTASVSATTVEVAMGGPTFRGKFTITDAAITSTSKVLCWQAPGPYTGKGTRADEAEMQPVSVIAVEPGTGSAVVRWQTPPMIATSELVTTMSAYGGGTVAANGINRDPQFTSRRLGMVRGNVKFSYTVMA